LNYKKKLDVLNEKLGISPKKGKAIENKTSYKTRKEDLNEDEK